MANRFFIKPRILHPRLVRLFRHCNSTAIVSRLNCYGAAVLPRLRGAYNHPQPGYFSQGFRNSVFAFEIERTVSFRLYARYMALADGHIPLTLEQAEKSGERNHVFVGVTVGNKYHFYSRTRHEHDGRLAWIHKSGDDDLSHRDGSQSVITDISLTLHQYVNNPKYPASSRTNDDGVIGFFKFPKHHVQPDQKTPPRYSRRAVRDMAEVFHEYLDTREQNGAGHSSRITEADVMMQRVKELMPHAVEMFAKHLHFIKGTKKMPSIFKSINVLVAEIKALGLTHHPDMASVIARIDAKKLRARKRMQPAQPRKTKHRQPQRRKLELA